MQTFQGRYVFVLERWLSGFGFVSFFLPFAPLHPLWNIALSKSHPLHILDLGVNDFLLLA